MTEKAGKGTGRTDNTSQTSIDSKFDLSGANKALTEAGQKHPTYRRSAEMSVRSKLESGYTPLGDSVDTDRIDDIIIDFCKNNQRTDVAPFEEQCQPYSPKTGNSSGLCRIYLDITDEKTRAHTMPRFVKAIIKGDPITFTKEGLVQYRIRQKTHVVPEVHFTEELYIPYGMVMPVIGMEVIVGMNLKEYIDTKKPSLYDKVMLLRDIASAVGEIHAAGYVHRDIKPENIIITDGDIVRIIDLGIAARIGEPVKSTSINGTPRYMSIAHLHNQVDPKMDIYSLGCIFYEMLTGQVPHENAAGTDKNTPEELQAMVQNLSNSILTEQHLRDPPEDVRQKLNWLNSDLKFILTSCLKTDPKEMYDNCDALAESLTLAADHMDFFNSIAEEFSRANPQAILPSQEVSDGIPRPIEESDGVPQLIETPGTIGYEQRQMVSKPVPAKTGGREVRKTLPFMHLSQITGDFFKKPAPAKK